MRKLLLKCGLSPGDIVMLTAAVRDLHKWYPRRFRTDVRTLCPELWEHNPNVKPLSEDDLEVKQIECRYPLINKSNEAPYHCLHGFIAFLNERLRLSIKPTAFKGDIHLSAAEKAWCSQVHELTGEDTPFWIIAAGGKYDVTIKWWETERYQKVVDHFRSKILFVQVGQKGHHHPRLDGVIDLRGQTDLRQLVRLVYHAEGVLCSVTALMHLAAAIETRGGRPVNRACVVVAGGREPAHWEAYPDHQFIHTNGALDCCSGGGCWKDRTLRLRDGDTRDDQDHLCRKVAHGVPRCMDMITSEDVIQRIETYFNGSALKYLSKGQWTAAEKGIRATAVNPYDERCLNLHSAGIACDHFVRNVAPGCLAGNGRGIVICGGGTRYFPSAWVCINMLRRLECHLPIQLWYLGDGEVDEPMKALVSPLGVECVDAIQVRKRFPIRLLHGWELKAYAIVHSAFREVLLLDADNVPVVRPEFMFDTPEFKAAGAVFWPDYNSVGGAKAKAIWHSCGLRPPAEQEFESGQILVDKERCSAALRLSLWFNENSDFYYQYVHGDKETFHLAFQKMKQSYSLIPFPIHPLSATMCQHDFQGRRIFQHRNLDKWDLMGRNRHIEGFWFEGDCLGYLAQLQERWKSGIGGKRLGNLKSARRRMSGDVLKVQSIVPAVKKARENHCPDALFPV